MFPLSKDKIYREKENKMRVSHEAGEKKKTRNLTIFFRKPMHFVTKRPKIFLYILSRVFTRGRESTQHESRIKIIERKVR